MLKPFENFEILKYRKTSKLFGQSWEFCNENSYRKKIWECNENMCF